MENKPKINKKILKKSKSVLQLAMEGNLGKEIRKVSFRKMKKEGEMDDFSVKIFHIPEELKDQKDVEIGISRCIGTKWLDQIFDLCF